MALLEYESVLKVSTSVKTMNLFLISYATPKTYPTDEAAYEIVLLLSLSLL